MSTAHLGLTLGTVLIHAGMPKTGSTSLQEWLGANVRRLRREADVQVLAARPANASGGVRVRPPVTGRPDSTPLAELYNREASLRGRLAERLCERLAEHASRARVTVISSEAFAGAFWRVEDAFLSPLTRLAEEHEVRVAYYVRPQDEAIEATWKQWGFRELVRPSQWVKRDWKRLHYSETLQSVSAHAPRLSFEPRPFRRDLLVGGDVVEDFARHFLGLAGPVGRRNTRSGDRWTNVSLPLEVANTLHALPAGPLWSSLDDNRLLDTIKRLVANFDAPETSEIWTSRLILRDFAHRTFEPGNREMARALGWPIDAFVPLVADELGPEEGRLDRLDDLWRSNAATIELALLHAALAEASSARGALRLVAERLSLFDAPGRVWRLLSTPKERRG